MIELPHLETRITLACQNRCIACNAFVPMHADDFKATFVDPVDFERDLAHFARVARTKIWAAMGGEPLLHPRLVEFLAIARASRAVELVEVRTNGQALADMPETFWRCVDVLIVTAYPGKDVDAERWARECASRRITFELRYEPQFVRLLEGATEAEATREKYRSCWFRTFCRVLNGGFFYRCCTTPHIPSLVLGLPVGTDGLRVDAELTEEKLAAYLDAAEPPRSCAVCCGMGTASTTVLPWREVEGRNAWLEASGLPTAAVKA
jgi:hypothetical protein